MPQRFFLVSLALPLCGCKASSESTCDPCDTQPGLTGEAEVQLREVLAARRSTDYAAPFGPNPITVEDVEAIAWAAQGVTLPDVPTHWPGVKGLRTAPSAGATYPLDLYVVAERVTGLEQGAYHYVPANDALESTGVTGPLAEAVAQIRRDEYPASDPKVFSDAAAIFILTDTFQRTSDKYGPWADLYIAIETGHVGQNILLMATARGLAHRPWGAMGTDAREQLAELLNLSADELLDEATRPGCYQPSGSKALHWPLYFIGVGQKP
ncbi:MAG: SagB/ThcOx family dehydrogenase [Deltaproteobacteria bacterium]|nr:SagB/ThcOx family dehydrogenase [Deltaproteobacteria bacterium]